jgi:hypothetical protein
MKAARPADQPRIRVMELRAGLEVQCPHCGSWHRLVGPTLVTTTADQTVGTVVGAVGVWEPF